MKQILFRTLSILKMIPFKIKLAINSQLKINKIKSFKSLNTQVLNIPNQI
jgi:hypothetical protein